MLSLDGPAVPLAAAGARLRQGAQVAQLRIGFSTAVDGRVDKLVENLAVIKPTFVARGAPHLREGAQQDRSASAQGGRRRSSRRSSSGRVGVGRKASALRQAGREPQGLLALEYAIARQAGLLQAAAAIRRPAALLHLRQRAALAASCAEFFHAAGMPILEGYGLTETSAASFVNVPEQVPVRHGGHRPAGHRGEDCPRGRRDPHPRPRRHARLPQPPGGHRATRSTPTAGCTPGTSASSTDGFLRITDRKKDLIKTSGGKYVAPQMMEGKTQGPVPVRQPGGGARQQPQLLLGARSRWTRSRCASGPRRRAWRASPTPSSPRTRRCGR